MNLVVAMAVSMLAIACTWNVYVACIQQVYVLTMYLSS